MEATNREQFNAGVRDWGNQALAELRARAPRRSGELQRNLALRMHQRDGVANSVGIQIARYTVYREKGAYRGHGGAKGSKWWSTMATRTVKSGPLKGTVQRGGWRKTDPHSLNKLGPERPYINAVLDARMPALLDVMVQHYGDEAVDILTNPRIK